MYLLPLHKALPRTWPRNSFTERSTHPDPTPAESKLQKIQRLNQDIGYFSKSTNDLSASYSTAEEQVEMVPPAPKVRPLALNPLYNLDTRLSIPPSYSVNNPAPQPLAIPWKRTPNSKAKINLEWKQSRIWQRLRKILNKNLFFSFHVLLYSTSSSEFPVHLQLLTTQCIFVFITKLTKFSLYII